MGHHYAIRLFIYLIRFYKLLVKLRYTTAIAIQNVPSYMQADNSLRFSRSVKQAYAKPINGNKLLTGRIRPKRILIEQTQRGLDYRSKYNILSINYADQAIFGGRVACP